MGLHVKGCSEGRRRAGEVRLEGEFTEVGGDGVVGGRRKESIFVENDISLGGGGAGVLLMAEGGEEDYGEKKDEESIHGF